MSFINAEMKLVWLVSLNILCAACSAQNSEVKTTNYPDDGLSFTTRLIRQNGLLVGYEMEIKNISKVRLDVDYLPTVPSEASGITIREAGGVNQKPLDIGSVSYPMHHPTIRQALLQKQLPPSDSVIIKGTFQEFFNAYKGDRYLNLTRTDLTNPATPRAKFDLTLSYDISFGPTVNIVWPNQTWSENVRRSSKIKANILFQDKLTFYNVKVLEK